MVVLGWFGERMRFDVFNIFKSSYMTSLYYVLDLPYYCS